MLMDAGVDLADQPVETESARRRGPLRPGRLLSVRERQSHRLDAHTFRLFDVVAVAGIALLVLSGSVPGTLREATVAHVLPLALGATALARMLRSFGLYRLGSHEGLISHLGRVCVAAAIAAGLAVGAHWALGGDHQQLRTLLIWAALSATGLGALHTTWWRFVHRWRSQGLLTPNIVIVGATAHAEALIADAMERRDMHVLGIFDDRRDRSPYAVLGVPVLGDTEDLLTHKITPFVDLIVVAVDPAATNRVRHLATRLATLPNQVTLIFDQHDATRRAAAIERLTDAPLAPLSQQVDADRRAFAKRVQDLVLAVPMLILFSPVLALVALAVKLDSRGPVFFRQRRHGFNNEEIVVWKFRTMRHAAADPRAERQVSANDDRVTRIGRILRKTSLDELPQLINVVAGEMSLVGPRPHAIGMRTGEVESARLVAEYAHRHRIKPGMTGWAAVRGSRGPLHSPADVARRVELDVEYIDRQSLWFDLRIMLLTIPSMLGDRTTVR